RPPGRTHRSIHYWAARPFTPRIARQVTLSGMWRIQSRSTAGQYPPLNRSHAGHITRIYRNTPAGFKADNRHKSGQAVRDLFRVM
ncbi:MAG: hypothetical protein WC156_16665, partial [Pedobacter sp.]